MREQTTNWHKIFYCLNHFSNYSKNGFLPVEHDCEAASLLFLSSLQQKHLSWSSSIRTEIICCCQLCCNTAFFSLSWWIHYACSVSLWPIFFRGGGGGGWAGLDIFLILYWGKIVNADCAEAVLVEIPLVIRVAVYLGQHTDAQISTVLRRSRSRTERDKKRCLVSPAEENQKKKVDLFWAGSLAVAAKDALSEKRRVTLHLRRPRRTLSGRPWKFPFNLSFRRRRRQRAKPLWLQYELQPTGRLSGVQAVALRIKNAPAVECFSGTGFAHIRMSLC